jgi:hypothetical protein
VDANALGFVLELGDVLLGEKLEEGPELVDVDGHDGRER